MENRYNARTLVIAVTVFSGMSMVHAGFHGVTNFSSSQGGGASPRTFVGTGFLGSSTVFDTSNIGAFTDGNLKSDQQNGGWADPLKRDMSTSGNKYDVNPDREVGRSPFALEASNKGTLQEVFGGNNLSKILDGEGTDGWTVDLLFGNGQVMNVGNLDANNTDVNIAILERGHNSKINLRGITGYMDGNAIVTDSITFDMTGTGASAYVGFKLKTLEIDSSQKVYGLGASLAQFDAFAGKTLIGFQLQDPAGGAFGGADIVDVLVAETSPVPEPATLTALALGGAALIRKRRLAQKKH